jgi:hypothetical protein
LQINRNSKNAIEIHAIDKIPEMSSKTLAAGILRILVQKDV